jgi:hypothetical protein
MPNEQTPDELERQAQHCLAKAAYCKWAASLGGEDDWKQYLVRLEIEWQTEAAKLRAALP